MLGNSDDAKDVVQSLFVDLVREKNMTSDLAYLYRATTNRCLTLMRDEKNRARLRECHDESLRGPLRTTLDDEVLGTDLMMKVLAALDAEEAEILTYRCVDDLTQDEIAELLNISRKTVGKRLDRIRDEVRKVRGASERSPS